MKWLNGSVRNYLLFTGVIIAASGSGWKMYARLDDKIALSTKESYSRNEGEILAKALEKMQDNNRDDFKRLNRKLDVLLGIEPLSTLGPK